MDLAGPAKLCNFSSREFLKDIDIRLVQAGREKIKEVLNNGFNWIGLHEVREFFWSK